MSPFSPTPPKSNLDSGFFLSVGLAACLFIALTIFEHENYQPNSFMKMEKAIIGQQYFLPFDCDITLESWRFVSINHDAIFYKYIYHEGPSVK